VGFEVSLRCRAREAIAVIERAVIEQGIARGTLTLGTDNGSAFTARATRTVLLGLGVAHRRGGYRDPESQAFIESWFSKLKERLIWRMEFETLHQLRAELGAYIERYQPPPAQRARPPNTEGGSPNLGRCSGATTQIRGLNCQHRRGAGPCGRPCVLAGGV